MSVEIAWKQNILVTDFHLLKSLLVVLGFGSQAFVCGFSRQNINSVFQSHFELVSSVLALEATEPVSEPVTQMAVELINNHIISVQQKR